MKTGMWLDWLDGKDWPDWKVRHEYNLLILESMGYWPRPVHWNELPKFLRMDALRQYFAHQKRLDKAT